jgi:16S rRNA (guanine966-N2)-methyltransferase
MGHIRIIAGELRGRVIPFSNKEFGDADITSQKVKGALFSMIGEWLYGMGFLDLYAGSGQVGLEALSRGADPVVMNEPDPKRFQFIKSYVNGLYFANRTVLLNLDGMNALDHLKSNGMMIRYIFLDPPYDRTRGGAFQYNGIIERIAGTGVLLKDGKIVVQHYSANVLDREIGPYFLQSTKKYGTTSLSMYR